MDRNVPYEKVRRFGSLMLHWLLEAVKPQITALEEYEKPFQKKRAALLADRGAVDHTPVRSTVRS